MTGPAQERGFSLVEVMMVVAIIGLMASVVVLSFPSRSTELQQSLQRTEQTLIALSRNSILSGRIVGVVFSRTGLSTLILGDDGWVDDDTLLKNGELQWAPATLVSLSVEGTDQTIEGTQAIPHVWYLPTGEHPAFEIAFSSDSGGARMSANASSAIQVTYDDAR